MRTIIFLSVAIPLCGLCIYWQSTPTETGGEDKKPLDKALAAEIDKLLKQLANDDPGTREAAAKALVKIGDDALPALKAAAKSDDAALVRAVDEIISQINEARVQAKADRAAKYGIDVVVERMVKKGKKLTDEDWLVLCRIIDGARTEAEARGIKIKGSFPYPAREVLAWPLVFAPHERKIGDKLIENDCDNSRLVAESMKVRFNALGSLVVCGGKIDVNPGSACILANGDMRAPSGVTGSILICDGEVWMNGLQRCVVLASGRIKIRSPLGAKDIILREKYTDGFGKIRFFSPSDLGVQIAGEQTPGEAPVGAFPITVEADSVLGRHGLRPGQQFWSINGARPKDAEEARIMLRSGIAEGRLVIEVLGGPPPMKIDFPW